MSPLVQSSPWLLPVLAALVGLAALGLWALARAGGNVGQTNLQRRFADAFGDTAGPNLPDGNAAWLERLGNQLIQRHKTPDREEVALLLARAGWKRKTDLAAFFALQTVLPVVAVVAASQVFFIGAMDRRDWGILFLAGSAAWLLPKRVIAYLAATRQARIAEQTPVLVHLLRILLGTGLSVEQALRSLIVDTRELLPDIAVELDYLLRRIDAGEDIAVAILGISRKLDVPAFTDLAMILEQTWRMGGSVLKSLTDLSNLIEDRMQTDLKEKVSKLSGKMTIVMMLFLFPALLVFLAAPGFLAIAAGLKNAAG